MFKCEMFTACKLIHNFHILLNSNPPKFSRRRSISKLGSTNGFRPSFGETCSWKNERLESFKLESFRSSWKEPSEMEKSCSFQVQLEISNFIPNFLTSFFLISCQTFQLLIFSNSPFQLHVSSFPAVQQTLDSNVGPSTELSNPRRLVIPDWKSQPFLLSDFQ